MRLVGKAADFHYLERNHYEAVLKLEQGVQLGAMGVAQAAGVELKELSKWVVVARDITLRADTDLFWFEEMAFRLFGFGGVLDLPRENRKVLENLINDSTTQVDSGAELVGKAGHAMQGITNSVREVQSLVEQMARAGSQQEAGIRDVGEAVQRIDAMTQQNAALVEQAAAAAQSMSEQAQQLANEVLIFRLN